MYNIISRFMQNLTKEQIDQFAKTKNANLSEEELEFTYQFVKKNWETVIKNPKLLHLERYKEHYSEENYQKIVKLFNEYSSKYQTFLK